MLRRCARPSGPLAIAALLALAAPPSQPAAAAPTPDGPRAFMIGADLSFLPQEEVGGAVFRDTLGAADAMTLMHRHGFDWVRLRVWDHPGDGHGGLEEMLGLARRATALRQSLLIDLHYSDTWADPGHQSPPVAWATLPLAALEDSVYRYSRDVVAALVAQGTAPDVVQLGNEITAGLLWDAGRVGGAWDTPAQWTALAALLKAGARGVADGAPRLRVRIMLHLDRGGDRAGCQWFLDHVVAQGVPFDLIGLSYYPWWHGPLEALAANLNALATRYDRDLVVVETAYPWTVAALDGTTNLVGPSTPLLADHPPTPRGQAAFLRRLAEVVCGTPRGHGRGVFVWAPDWVSAPRFGSAGENLALFDASGRALPALDALAAVGPRTVLPAAPGVHRARTRTVERTLPGEIPRAR